MASPTTASLALAMMMGLPCEARESLPDGVHRAGPAELKIERKAIGESASSKPIPQGTVDANPPWLHVQVALPAAKKEAKAQQWQRRFYFKLSQDPELKRNVIESGPKRWSFYNPYRTLERGTWYWTYGVAPAETPEAPVWHKEVFSFLVDDQAFAPAIPPTPEQALAAIRKHQSGPVAICLNEDIGRMLPEKTWPEAAVRLRKQADQALREGERPVRVELSEKVAMLQMWRQFPAPDLSKAPAPAESAAVFRDVGMAAMHRDILDPARNLAVSFTSAVNGSFQHLHPSQNAFCVGYGGEPLFWRTGYYNGGQAHDAMSYKASRAHNTLLVDGCMQGFDLGAYGWMPRFVTGSRISYALGDASNAYNGMFPKYKVSEPDKPLPPGLQVLGVPITRENGFGKPGVTRFRRHLVMLRPSHLLILDELEAVRPVTWTFQLHSLQVMQQRANAWFTAANGKGTGGARLFCTAPVVGSVGDQFFAPAVDEENKRGGKNPPHWHATIATREKLAATRFMTIIEVQPGTTRLEEPVATGEGKLRWQLGDYQVSADLDPARPSWLEIRDQSGTCALVTGQAAAEISLGVERRSAKAKGSTLLWEKPLGKPEIFREVVDQLPPVLVFGNRY